MFILIKNTFMTFSYVIRLYNNNEQKADPFNFDTIINNYKSAAFQCFGTTTRFDRAIKLSLRRIQNNNNNV